METEVVQADCAESIAEAVDRSVALLSSGEIVALPTETVYGLAADASNEEAVAKIFEVKGRPRFDPLIVHVPTTRCCRSMTLQVPCSLPLWNSACE